MKGIICCYWWHFYCSAHQHCVFKCYRYVAQCLGSWGREHDPSPPKSALGHESFGTNWRRPVA